MSRGGVSRARAETVLIGVTALWGTTFVVVKHALTAISPLLFVALRFTVAAVALWLIYGRVLRRKVLENTDWVAGTLAGGLLFAAFACQTKGLELTTPSKSAFLTSLSIPMVPLANSLVYRVRPRVPEVAGIVTASAGMVLMTLPRGLLTAGLDLGRGDFLTFICAVLFALHIVVLGHFSPIVGFESLAVIQVAVVAALALVSFSFGDDVTFRPGGGVIAAVLVTGLLATALAFTTMAWAQQYTTSTRTAIIFALEPLVAWVTSWLLTGEKLGIGGMTGAGLILAGILLVEIRIGEPKALKRAQLGEHHY